MSGPSACVTPRSTCEGTASKLPVWRRAPGQSLQPHNSWTGTSSCSQKHLRTSSVLLRNTCSCHGPCKMIVDLRWEQSARIQEEQAGGEQMHEQSRQDTKFCRTSSDWQSKHDRRMSHDQSCYSRICRHAGVIMIYSSIVVAHCRRGLTLKAGLANPTLTSTAQVLNM